MGNDISKALFDKRQELELKYEARTREHELEVKKAEMNHQHKIIELMALMKQTKFQGGKELLLSYMETLNIIIRQNSTVFEKAASLLDQLGNDNLPESLKKSIEKAVQKDLEGYMTTQELLDYARSEVDDLKFKQDKEFSELLNCAIGQKLTTKYFLWNEDA